MKICTITCHDVYNCGASLQAYALQSYLMSLGHDTRIIDYKPDYLSFHYRWNWYVNRESPYYSRCKNNILFRFMYVTRRFFMDLKSHSKVKAFNCFTRNYLQLTDRYKNYKTLKTTPPEADLYIVGSDQVWNRTLLDNGKDPAFYLCFGENKSRRISYAASFGATDTVDEITRNHLSKLDAISVREEEGKNLIEKTGLQNCCCVCDPVFLLDRTQWEKIIPQNSHNEEYILIYNLGTRNESLFETAKKLKKQYGYKIYSIVTQTLHNDVDKNIEEVGPLEFLREIKNAKFVLSNSFHATAFSIIFEVDFYTFSTKNTQSNKRMSNLLERLSLSDRFDVSLLKNESHIDYDERKKKSLVIMLKKVLCGYLVN